MMNLTENLYKVQWLDLIFKDRNKAYGAYELRLHNSSRTAKAFMAANALFIGAILLLFILSKSGKELPAPITKNPEKTITVEISKYKEPVKKQTPLSAPKTPTEIVKAKSVKYTKMVIVPAIQVTEEAPTQKEISNAVVASVQSDGAVVAGNQPLTSDSGNGLGTATQSDENQIFDMAGMEIYPEFPGGEGAFAKFLGKNINYPIQARDNHIQGKVIVKFVIEKNGELSNIVILRSVGSGIDEEAIRVLKKSPRWKAGKQNNQFVRVAYTIPISFKLPD